jgi:hypothetical protein
LKVLGITVKKAFAKSYQVLDEFEGETNVMTITAKDFLDNLRNLGITQLSELEIACLMRVLSKPEIDHSIVLNELNLVLENFGIIIHEEDKEVIQEEAEKKKQKLNKKKLIKNFIHSAEGDDLYHTLCQVLNKL